jgi:phosphoglycerate kinase
MARLHKLSIEDLALQDTRLFMRVDFNVPLNQQRKAYTFLKAQGLKVGNSLVEDEYEGNAAQILQDADQRGITLLLAQDHVVAKTREPGVEHRTVGKGEIPEGWMSLDIGPATRKAFVAEIRHSQTICWNGPMGVSEIEPFDQSTRAVGQAVAECSGFTVVGGGDTVAAVRRIGITDQIGHLSTGGGAALEFLEGKDLPGVAALSDKPA